MSKGIDYNLECLISSIDISSLCVYIRYAICSSSEEREGFLGEAKNVLKDSSLIKRVAFSFSRCRSIQRMRGLRDYSQEELDILVHAGLAKYLADEEINKYFYIMQIPPSMSMREFDKTPLYV